MTELPTDSALPELSAVVPGPATRAAGQRWRVVLASLFAVLAVLSVAAIAMAWRSNQRVASVEQELVRRQQESAGQAAEARVVAREAQDSARDAGAKVALLEARVAEMAAQRTQLEDLVQSLSRSRDENLLGDIESAIRVASQQTFVSGSAEPLVAALKQSNERLGRQSDPRLDPVRRAVARDLDRVKAAAVNDIPSLGIKLDEAIRLVDELPLISSAEARGAASPAAAEPARPASAASGASAFASWTGRFSDGWALVANRVGAELRSLVRVTRIDHPDAMLVAPEQGVLLRENVKLRLLNARLSLLSRQFDNAQSDLAQARSAIERYFDPKSRRTAAALELVRQVAAQSRQVVVPRPDDTLAALASAATPPR